MRFNKYKFTNNLFFKDVQFANVDVNKNEINILIPFFSYAGTYYIHSVSESVGYMHYRTVRADEGIDKEELLSKIDRYRGDDYRGFLIPEHQKEELKKSMHRNLLYSNWFYRNFTAKNVFYNKDEFFIDISKPENKLRLYDGNFKGVILKK